MEILLPISSRQRGSALLYVHSLRPISSVAVHYNNSAAYCPGPVSMYIAAAPLAIAQRQCGGALHFLRCLLPPESVAVHCNIVTAYCP